MTSCPEAIGWGFWNLKKTVSWDLGLDEGSRFLELTEARPAVCGGVPHVVGSNGKVSIVRNCVSLSSCRTQFLPGSGCVDTAIWMHHMDAYEAAGEEAGRKLHKNVESSIKQVLATTPHETPTIRTLAPHHENYTSLTNQTRRTLLEKLIRTSS